MKATPFLLVTAETEVAQVSHAGKLGVSGYVTKPFSATTFKDKLEKLSAKA
jgi:two-component system, chemotaxis family, chemotaxis protein CheY